MATVIYVLRTTMLVVLGLASSLRAEAMEQMDIQALIVHHTQGWGQMGVGVAAHMPGSKPLTMRIKDFRYSTGLGVHAPSDTLLMLNGRYSRFRAMAGVQWQEGLAGSVVMQAFVDGVKVFDSGLLRESSDPVAVDVPLVSADELRLVVTDGGDGITCDAANWADVHLERDVNATMPEETSGVDIAPFAAVRSWDPTQTEGTTATRLEAIPEDELFPGATVRPQPNGSYAVPLLSSGQGSIGLEWLERRRIARLELEGQDRAPAPVETQYWEMGRGGGSPGGSRWQGRWQPLTGETRREGNRWIMIPSWQDKPEARTGTLKVRWIFAGDQPPILKAFHAYTITRWKTAELHLTLENPASTDHGQIALYNGSWNGPESGLLEWPLDKPLDLTVEYAPPRIWQLADRTVLRFTLPHGAFGVAVDDVVERGSGVCGSRGSSRIGRRPRERRRKVSRSHHGTSHHPRRSPGDA